MTRGDCRTMRLLVQADVDGELSAADTVVVEAHLLYCPDCAVLQGRLLSLRRRIRLEVPRHVPRPELLAQVRARIAATASSGRPPRVHSDDVGTSWRDRLRAHVGPFGAGFALAACLALAVMPAPDRGLADAVVSDHIRALQPGHLMDVVSTDQHTVKPWFDGRLDFAPPVRDLSTAGFSLVGGRLDYVAGQPAAVLVYRRREHVIDLYVWPDAGRSDRAPAGGSHSGYNYLRWGRDNMAFWAVSDLDPSELIAFAGLLRRD